MKTVAIISEYNPFHNGHLYQLEKIREALGEDISFIAIMSGNYTQRGELAIIDKWQRAKAAVDCGVNLILELPFPYSCSSAELFARAGVHVAEKIGVVDYLAFGSETGNLEQLKLYADRLLSDEFAAAINALCTNKENDSLGYPALCKMVYEKLYGASAMNIESNDILAVEYIKALKILNSNIQPIAIKREGSGYNDEQISDHPRQSATAIRNLFLNNYNSALNYIPQATFNVVCESFKRGLGPVDCENLSSAILATLRLSTATSEANVHDAGGGLYNRLVSKSYEATDISSLIELSMTKKYTKARIRRAIWYSFFGVTSSDVKTMPEYTQVLAFDSVGQMLLKKIKKTSKFEVITKSSALPKASPALIQRQLCDKADSVYQLAKPQKKAQGSIYKETPYVKV